MLGGTITLLVFLALASLFFTKEVPPPPPAVTFENPIATEIVPPAPQTPEATETRISVDLPTPGSLVKSPLTVSGKARGNWYFEASFPVELVDENGVTLAQIPAQAQGDWMTEDFVPFTATLTWESSSASTTRSGVLIFHRDNPSGMPEHDASISVPVIFYEK